MNVYSGSLHKDAFLQWGFTQRCRLAVGVYTKMHSYSITVGIYTKMQACNGRLHKDDCIQWEFT